jgi:auxin-responsive protein IAA
LIVFLKNGFHSANAAADCSGAGTGEKDAPNSDKFIFLYEDFEGDRMLVGDVPWE